MRELQGQLDMREEKIRELRLQLETTKESEAKQVALVHTLNTRLAEFEAQAGSLEGIDRMILIAKLELFASTFKGFITVKFPLSLMYRVRNLKFATSKTLLNFIKKMIFCLKIGIFQFRKL